MRALIIGWGVGGVCLILLNPILRLSQPVLEVLPGGLTPLQWGITALWTGFMLYTEGWRGFHKQFSPRVVRRAWALADKPVSPLIVVAPLMCMGLIHASRKRLIISWSLVTMIVVLVMAVRLLLATSPDLTQTEFSLLPLGI